MTSTIQLLTRADDAAVWDLMHASADYIRLERNADPTPALVQEFFTDAPPGKSPDDGHRAGLFDAGRLLALAELSFGYPADGDSYLGLMLLRPDARGQGVGPRLLHHLETVARVSGAVQMYLAVLDINPRGRAFWLRQGFGPTGHSGTNPDTGQLLHRLVKPL